jgi:hypothetical protein
MISLAIAATGGFMWLTGQYEKAFWFVVLSIISGLGAVVMSIANPDWYASKRMQAGLEIDFFNPSKGIGGLIVTKIITTAILAWCAWKLGQLAGYFA